MSHFRFFDLIRMDAGVVTRYRSHELRSVPYDGVFERMYQHTGPAGLLLRGPVAGQWQACILNVLQPAPAWAEPPAPRLRGRPRKRR